MADTDKTIPSLLQQRVSDTPDAAAFAERDSEGDWQTITWKQFAEKASRIALGLVNAGLEPGDELAVLMSNSIDWELIQHAGFMAGCIVIGLDLNDPPDRLAHIIKGCNIKALAVESSDILDRFSRSFLASQRLILDRGSDLPHPSFHQLKKLQDFPAAPGLPSLPGIKGKDNAVLLFTSGTTGDPKVVLYQHRQLVMAVESISRRMSGLPGQPRSACWLPLASPFQRMINWCGLVLNFKTHIVRDPGALIPLAGEIRPHFLAGVPRFYEKLHEGICSKIAQLPGIVRFWIAQAEKISRAAQQGFFIYPCLAVLNRIADILFFRRIRKVLGGSIRFMISGSAPLAKDLLFRYRAWGFLILESYGISENIIPMSMNTPEDYGFGTVGKPLAGNLIKISGAGEILVKGAGIAGNLAAADRNGFLKTGDLGYFDKKGRLCLTGRQSDTFKLSTGRKIVPSVIESRLKQIQGVDHAVVTGAGQKYIIALLNIPDWEQMVSGHGSESCARRFLQDAAEEATRSLPPYCRPGHCLVIRTPFSIGAGELTTSLKVRRSRVLEMHEQKINSTYKGD